MRGIVAAAATAVFILATVDAQFNDSRYSGAILRAVESLVGR
jgi:hypothetical protein